MKKNRLKIMVVLLPVIILLCPKILFAASQTFTSSGTFVVPAGVTQISVTAAAGGGGGGAGAGSISGGGGSGDAILNQAFAVSPGASYAVTVGAGGAGGSFYNVVCNTYAACSAVDGKNGSATAMPGLFTLQGGTADSMWGNPSPSANCGFAGGPGGTNGQWSTGWPSTNGCVNNPYGYPTRAGSGGGNIAGGTGGLGGGTNGLNWYANQGENGGNGVNGGGGGSGGYTSSTNLANGGSGGNGFVQITYTAAQVIPPAPTGLSLSCSNGTVTASWNPVSGVSNYLLRMQQNGTYNIYEDNWSSTSISRYVGLGTYSFWMHAGTTSNYGSPASGSVTCAPTITDAEAQCYLNRYSDLAGYYGATNIAGAKSHWYAFGYVEGRDKSCPTDNGCAANTCNTTTCYNNISWVTGTKNCPTDNGCAANTCNTNTCYNNISWVWGTKNCPTDNGCAANTCNTSTCYNNISWVWGTKNCPTDNGCAANTCNTNQCYNNISWVWGTKNCPTDNGCAANTCNTTTCYNNLFWVTGTKNCAVDNGCAARTCMGQTCNNSITTVAGTKTPTYSAYYCAELDTHINAFCATATNCGLNVSTNAADFACTATDDCTGLAGNSRSVSECNSNGAACPYTTKTIQCPGCQLKVNKFIETTP